ncbi:CLUMA_CG015612, isoform A [Clunio marinus]|uniref:CLUMA_CG015612, isoform A n=1 Tax=Clunio marinus TaxID=568069 RepID=A0A1J1IQ60_9DIPT|nr:CLUMA_CG015612, isoform A [Clunio marinus]
MFVVLKYYRKTTLVMKNKTVEMRFSPSLKCNLNKHGLMSRHLSNLTRTAFKILFFFSYLESQRTHLYYKSNGYTDFVSEKRLEFEDKIEFGSQGIRTIWFYLGKGLFFNMCRYVEYAHENISLVWQSFLLSRCGLLIYCERQRDFYRFAIALANKQKRAGAINNRAVNKRVARQVMLRPCRVKEKMGETEEQYAILFQLSFQSNKSLYTRWDCDKRGT